MSIDRLKSAPGAFLITPELDSSGFPGSVQLGMNAGIVAGAAVGAGGASFSVPTPKAGTVPTIANSGTVTHNGHGAAVVTTGGAVTGAIVQAGTIAGQKLTIINNSANTITMAAVGTSNVANGVGAVISALAAIDLVWNALDSKWYQVRAA
jgi:hypothetical protein